MKQLDRLVALGMVAFFVTYIYLSFNFDLLPFEKRMKFRPDTMPQGIGIIGLILSLLVLVTAKGEENKDNANWRQFDYRRYIGMVVAMVVYATLLKPLGFVVATTAFLMAGAILLGERRYLKLTIVALTGAICIWLVVDKVLGIYLYPVPSFIKI